MANKPFRDLTKEEATLLARSCRLGARTEAEIRQRLTEAGFNGSSAAVAIHSSCGQTMAMLMVLGPHGEVINA